VSFRFFSLEVVESVGWYRFNRPPVNAVDWDMLDEMEPAFRALDDDPGVRVIVIASSIERYFNAGADVAAFRDRLDEMGAWIEKTHSLAHAVRSSRKPVLAALNGVAVGGGLEMTYHADLRFAASNARIGQPEVNLGFIPPVGGTQGLLRLIGRSNAFRLLYGGELVDAETAVAIGLVDIVVPPETLEAEVQRYAEALVKKPANALASIRRCLIEGEAGTFADGMLVEKEEANALARHRNFREGVGAFLDKRDPSWTDELD
jgi:enoyl-CoA hydratase